MSFSSFINNICSLLGLKLGRTISAWGNPFAPYGIKKGDFSISGHNIHFKELGISISRQKATAILEGYSNAIKLVQKVNARYSTDVNGDLNASIQDIRFKINDEEELFILYEVFVEGVYNLSSSTHKPLALIDIGMNVGITSLFYASKPNVSKVFSFEPFFPTYQMAMNNISLNPPFSDKIIALNIGLDKQEQLLQLPYSFFQKGRMAVIGKEKKRGMHKNAVMKQSVILKSAANEFQKIKTQIKEHFVVCKMDCEGAEYHIMDDLFSHGLISAVDVYFIEWHYKQPGDIVSKLLASNFNVIHTTSPNLNSGMIYALKNEGLMPTST
jgi:FkbM family methyltransferase